MTTIWMPQHPPETAHPSSDEFDDASVSAAWTEFDLASELTVSEDDRGLVLSTTGLTWGISGIYKAIPSGDFCIWTRVNLLEAFANQTLAGIWIAQDVVNNPTTADFVDLAVECHAHLWGWAAHWSAYDNSSWIGANFQAIEDVVTSPNPYLRMRYTAASGDIFCDWSTDGIGWQQFYTFALANAAYMGIHISCNDDIAGKAAFNFFRCEATNALTDVMGGRRADPDNPYAPPSTGLPFSLMQGSGFGFQRGAPARGVR